MLPCTKFSMSVLGGGLKIFKNGTLPELISRNCNKSSSRILHSAALNEKFKTKTSEDRLQFENTLPEIIREITNYDFTNMPDLSSRITRSLEYNLSNGKYNRGLAVVGSYKLLEKPERLTEENIRLANILGWTVELLQGFLLVMDDITDESETRRGKKCWYKQDDIGTTAINDGLFLENIIYKLLKERFSNHPSYVNIMELFHDAALLTIIGQMLDCNRLNVNAITMNRYENIALYKTAHYTTYLPVALGMYLGNLTDPGIHRQAREILLEIGKFFQIQDDFLDCFGDPKVTGKIGSDIETSKCTWLAVTCMQLASVEQKKIMENNYGKQDQNSVKAIKDLYLTLKIPQLYTQYEERSYDFLQTKIQKLSGQIPTELFNQYISRIYKRVC